MNRIFDFRLAICDLKESIQLSLAFIFNRKSKIQNRKSLLSLGRIGCVFRAMMAGSKRLKKSSRIKFYKLYSKQEDVSEWLLN